METFNNIVEQIETNPSFTLNSVNDLLNILKEEHINSRDDWLYEDVLVCQKNLIKNLESTDELFIEMRRVAWVFENIWYDFLSDRQQDSYKDIIYLMLTK